MAYQDKTPARIRLDERNHVEKLLPVQLNGLGWEARDRVTGERSIAPLSQGGA